MTLDCLKSIGIKRLGNGFESHSPALMEITNLGKQQFLVVRIGTADAFFDNDADDEPDSRRIVKITH